MKLCVSLVLLCVMLSTAYGLKCYVGVGAMTMVTTCEPGEDRCGTTILTEEMRKAMADAPMTISAGDKVKACMPSIACMFGVDCCDKDLCNGGVENDAEHVGSSVLLLLLSSAIVSLFL